MRDKIMKWNYISVFAVFFFFFLFKYAYASKGGSFGFFVFFFKSIHRSLWCPQFFDLRSQFFTLNLLGKKIWEKIHGFCVWMCANIDRIDQFLWIEETEILKPAKHVTQNVNQNDTQNVTKMKRNQRGFRRMIQN